MFSGQRLKEIREAQGMSQAAVAKHLGDVYKRQHQKRKNSSDPISLLIALFL